MEIGRKDRTTKGGRMKRGKKAHKGPGIMEGGWKESRAESRPAVQKEGWKHTVPTFEKSFVAVLLWGDSVRPRSCQALHAQRPVVQNTSCPELVLVIRLPFPSKAYREVK